MSSNAIPVATFHCRSHRTASAASASDRSYSVCNVKIVAATGAGMDGRPQPGWKQVGGLIVREHPATVLGQECEHAALGRQMPTNARASSTSADNRSTSCNAMIIPLQGRSESCRHAEKFSALLVRRIGASPADAGSVSAMALSLAGFDRASPTGEGGWRKKPAGTSASRSGGSLGACADIDGLGIGARSD